MAARTAALPHERVFNFGAGPCPLPLPVLEEAQRTLLNFRGSGMSVLEISHRSKQYEDVHDRAERDFRNLLNVPSNYKVLFMQGGGTAQFAAVPFNLQRGHATADYLVTGVWSLRALEEAKKYFEPNVVATGAPSKFTTLPPPDTWHPSPAAADPAYFYYCDNETVHGIEMGGLPPSTAVSAQAGLVSDMSSNILTRPVDVGRHALIFAGAQKNMGSAGLTVVVVRDDLLGNIRKDTPTALDYKVYGDNRSLYHTPPCFAIYLAGLVFDWVQRDGGVKEMEARAVHKSQKLYDAIDSSRLFRAPVDKRHRSRVNVVFHARPAGGDAAAAEKLAEQFASEAARRGLEQLKGHRLTGGLRASLYNAVSYEAVDALIEFLHEFEQQHET